MDMIAMVIGYVAIVVGILFALIILIDFSFTSNGWCVTFGGFGIMWVKDKTVRENVAKIRQHTNYDRAFYITAPTWFNRNVWNIGGSKEGE
jgi:hypothetical protein